METLCVISRKAPYATVDASEAIRHAMGGVVEEVSVRLILTGEGVNAARASQDTSETNYESIASGIEDCIDMDIEVIADRSSVVIAGIGEDSIVKGIKVLEGAAIAEMIMNSDQTMVF
jgi:predicted peroxiredoxin